MVLWDRKSSNGFKLQQGKFGLGIQVGVTGAINPLFLREEKIVL